jgi:hypothetical protein
MDESVLLDEAMLAWFPPTSNTELLTRTTFTEIDLRGISDLLYRSGKQTWSRIPRIYTTLRIIDEINAIEAFVGCDITDLAFPFDQRTLPSTFSNPSSRAKFLEAQSSVFTEGLGLEKTGSPHHHFASDDDIPFKKVADLGKGVHGYVDRVISTVTYREYARKLIPRGRTFRENRAVLRDFESELKTLKKLSHQHIVKLIGSYTDPR